MVKLTLNNYNYRVKQIYLEYKKSIQIWRQKFNNLKLSSKSFKSINKNLIKTYNNILYITIVKELKNICNYNF